MNIRVLLFFCGTLLMSCNIVKCNNNKETVNKEETKLNKDDLVRNNAKIQAPILNEDTSNKLVLNTQSKNKLISENNVTKSVIDKSSPAISKNIHLNAQDKKKDDDKKEVVSENENVIDNKVQSTTPLLHAIANGSKSVNRSSVSRSNDGPVIQNKKLSKLIHTQAKSSDKTSVNSKQAKTIETNKASKSDKVERVNGHFHSHFKGNVKILKTSEQVQPSEKERNEKTPKTSEQVHPSAKEHNEKTHKTSEQVQPSAKERNEKTPKTSEQVQPSAKEHDQKVLHRPHHPVGVHKSQQVKVHNGKTDANVSKSEVSVKINKLAKSKSAASKEIKHNGNEINDAATQSTNNDSPTPEKVPAVINGEKEKSPIGKKITKHKNIVPSKSEPKPKGDEHALKQNLQEKYVVKAKQQKLGDDKSSSNKINPQPETSKIKQNINKEHLQIEKEEEQETKDDQKTNQSKVEKNTNSDKKPSKKLTKLQNQNNKTAETHVTESKSKTNEQLNLHNHNNKPLKSPEQLGNKLDDSKVKTKKTENNATETNEDNSIAAQQNSEQKAQENATKSEIRDVIFKNTEQSMIKEDNQAQLESQDVNQISHDLNSSYDVINEENLAITREVSELNRPKKSQTTLVAVCLVLITSALLLSVVGIYYRNISIGRRKYIGHTILATEDELPLFNRDAYHDEEENIYESWSRVQH